MLRTCFRLCISGYIFISVVVSLYPEFDSFTLHISKVSILIDSYFMPFPFSVIGPGQSIATPGGRHRARMISRHMVQTAQNIPIRRYFGQCLKVLSNLGYIICGVDQFNGGVAGYHLWVFCVHSNNRSGPR